MQFQIIHKDLNHNQNHSIFQEYNNKSPKHMQVTSEF